MLGASILAGIIALITCGAGAVLLVALGAGAVIYVIIAAVKANQGEWFEYWLVGPWARKSIGV